MRTVSETAGTTLNAPAFALQGSPKKKKKRKDLRKYLKRLQSKTSLIRGRKQSLKSQEAQRVPYTMNPRRNMPRHILIKLTKIKDKEKVLRATREKQQIIYKGIPIRSSADFFSRNSAGKKGVAQYISNDEREISTTKNTLTSKGLIQI